MALLNGSSRGRVLKKSGRAYFLLGDKEARTNVKAFQSVQTDTVEIVNYLHAGGIDDRFDLVPGNHYQYGEQRLTRAFTWMFGKLTLSGLTGRPSDESDEVGRGRCASIYKKVGEKVVALQPFQVIVSCGNSEFVVYLQQ